MRPKVSDDGKFKSARKNEGVLEAVSHRRVEVTNGAFQRAFQSLQEAIESLQEWIASDDLQDEEKIEELIESLRTISRLQRSKSVPGEGSQSEQITSTCNDLDQILLVRDGKKRLIIARPMDIVDCITPYTIEKNVAYFRLEGCQQPQAYTISGATKCTQGDQLIVIDSALLLKHIRAFGDFFGHHFRTNGYDASENSRFKKGDGFACHAEVQAMVASAFFILEKFGKIKMSEATFAHLLLVRRLLKKYKLGRKIEIGISDEACHSCEDFQTFFEKHTGLQFIRVLMKNYAPIKKNVRDEAGKWFFPKMDSNGFVLGGDMELRVLQVRTERLQKNNEHLRKEGQRLSHDARKLRALEDRIRYEERSSRLEVMVNSQIVVNASSPRTSEKKAKKLVQTPISRRKRKHDSLEDQEYTPPRREARMERISSRMSRQKVSRLSGDFVSEMDELGEWEEERKRNHP